MATSELQVGSVNAPGSQETSQNFAVSDNCIQSLHDLLAVLAKNPPPDLAMLRTTAGHLAEYFDAPVEKILIESLDASKVSFRRYLEGRKYKTNSVRSFSNYLGILIKKAEGLGWRQPDPEVPQCWQRIMAAFPVGRRQDIVKHAVKLGRTPDQLTDEDLRRYRDLVCEQGITYQYAHAKLTEFRAAIRGAQLTDLFPKLLSLVPKEHYGIRLKAFPEDLRKEVEALLRWKQDDFAPGRPRKAQHRKSTAGRLEEVLSCLFGFARNIENRTHISGLAGLVTEDLVTTYAGWSINARKKEGTSFRGGLGLLYAALRHNPRYKNHDLAWFQLLLKSIPNGSPSEAADRKAKKILPYAVVNRIPEKIRALRSAAVKKGAKSLAATVRDELLMHWIVVLAWRQRNIRECRVGGEHPNLFKTQIPKMGSMAIPAWVREIARKDPDAKFWQFRFSERETKMGNRVHAILPQQLVGLLEEYLGEFRIQLLDGQDPNTLFIKQNGTPLSDREVLNRVSTLTLRHGGVRVTPHIYRDIVAYEWLEHHPEDYLSLSKILWHRNIQTTLQVYGSQFDESNGVCRMDEWLKECDAKVSSISGTAPDVRPSKNHEAA